MSDHKLKLDIIHPHSLSLRALALGSFSMRRTVDALLLLALLAIAGCATGPGIAERSDCAAGAEYYFPADPESPEQPGINSFMREWYSRHLAAMDEPSLSCGQQSDATYRFLWLRTFDHPIVIRITRTDDTTWLDAVELSGAGGYDPGTPMNRTRRQLAEDEWRLLEAKLAGSGFWTLPTNTERGGLDGAEWIVEGYKKGRYHVVTRWTPSNGTYRDLGLYFLSLSGFTVPPRELY